ncbi:MAG: thiamine pyrophosphate-dependent enzyme [Xanthobacteraceae bacterium]|jgi:sulfopyruvate decarboxylase subunit beta
MKTREAMRVLAAHRGDAVAVCALGMASNEWWQATKSEETFYMHGAMGFAASFALGFALTAPDVPVLLLNADGSLCMNLGCLLTEAQQAPKNLKHFLIDNRVYQTVSAVPMVNRELTDYAGIARAAGISRTLTIDNVPDLEQAVPEIMASPGPYFTVLRVEAEPTYLEVAPNDYEGAEMKYRFGRAMERRLGITIFGPAGY